VAVVCLALLAAPHLGQTLPPAGAISADDPDAWTSPREAFGEEESERGPDPNVPEACGVERWSVKTGTDADSGLVDLTSETLTEIATLISIPKPGSLPSNNRVAPTETTVYQVAATLTLYKLESDSDYHLVLDDGLGHTMIAEIASSACTGSTSPFAAQIANARAEFDAVLTASTSFKTANLPVLVTGVGFFDFAHGQTGLAPNCIELHPILDILFNPSGDFTLSKAPATVTVPQGTSGTVTVTTGVSGGFSSAVSLSATGLPSGASAAFNPATLPAPGSGNSTLTLTAGASTPAGTYPITVNAIGGGKSHSTAVSFVVTGSGAPPEVSGSGASVPFTLSGAGSEVTLRFQYMGAGTYHVYGAPGRASMDAGTWATKFCDLENNYLGSWNTDGLTYATWTTAATNLPEGEYVAVLESSGAEGPYGYKSDASPIQPDSDGTTPGNLGCEGPCATATASITGVTPGPMVLLGTPQTFTGVGTGEGTLTYEWDFHYDWANFDVEATGATPTYSYTSAAEYTVALRVTDSCDRPSPRAAMATVGVNVGLCGPKVVLSRVYGGGGNAGAYWKSDFVELHNDGDQPQSLAGWSVQYASATGSSWSVQSLTSGTVAAGGYFLLQEATGSGGTASLPNPDVTGTLSLAATAGKVALVASTTALSGTCPTGGSLRDFVGYGTTANCYEGAGPTAAPSNTTAVTRNGSGCADTNSNSADFTVGVCDATTPPRNSGSSPLTCSCP